jgi:LDH2 family malate/lactate/ureidoglycolate dehydrogenase
VNAVLVAADALQARTQALLEEAGARPEHAATAARVLVDADVRGHHSHGVSLLPTYLARLDAGGIDPRAEPRWGEAAGAALAVLEAGGGLGQVAAELAARRCAEAAGRLGLAAVGVRGNNHVGMLAAYREPFVDHGVVGLVLNISGPSVAPPGGARATLGNDALCLIVPRRAGPPFIVDFATGTVASGKVRQAALEGREVPDGWLLDAAGRPSSDPRDLDRGGSVPVFGGHKGLCVAAVVEVLAGGLVDGRSSARVHKQRAEPQRAMECAQLFVGFAAGALGGDPERCVDELQGAVAAAYDAAPAPPWFPEQLEQERARRHAAGVPLPMPLAAELGFAPEVVR